MVNAACDLDGVICNFHKHFSETLNSMFPHSPILTKKEEILNWDFDKFLPLTKEQVSQGFSVIRQDPFYWEKSDLLPEEGEWKDFLENIANNKSIDLYFLTTRSDTGGVSAAKQSCNWLQKHGVQHPQVIANIQDKKKSKIINALGIKYFLDDSGINIVDVSENCSNIKSFILDYPHNRYINHNKITRISSLHEYTQAITAK